jgi:hypothetical protein
MVDEYLEIIVRRPQTSYTSVRLIRSSKIYKVKVKDYDDEFVLVSGNIEDIYMFVQAFFSMENKEDHIKKYIYDMLITPKLKK